MSREYAFKQVDVFTDRIFGGNPLAVFTDGAGLTTDEMQAIALEMNLSETTFVLQPENPGSLAKIRIFTPRAELAFAGHPTVGTAWVLAQMGAIPAGQDQITLDLGLGPIGVDFEDAANSGAFVWMNQGTATFGEIVEDHDEVAKALGVEWHDLARDLPVQFASTGFPFLFVPMSSPGAVDRARLSDPSLTAAVPNVGGTFIFHIEPRSNRAYSRMITTIGGAISEDPATGSASGPLGAYVVEQGLSSGGPMIEIVSEQGTQMGRQSFVHIRVANEAGSPGEISVGGGVVPVFDGVLRLPD
jgi:trans-2,3-dihydro-3-hydroxyanthranilate isomerase